MMCVYIYMQIYKRCTFVHYTSYNLSLYSSNLPPKHNPCLSVTKTPLTPSVLILYIRILKWKQIKITPINK